MNYIGPVFIIAVLVLALCGSRYERWEWNHGKCRKHDRVWESMGTDSQGGHGYSCYDEGDERCVTWQTYGHDQSSEVA